MRWQKIIKNWSRRPKFWFWHQTSLSLTVEDKLHLMAYVCWGAGWVVVSGNEMEISMLWSANEIMYILSSTIMNLTSPLSMPSTRKQPLLVWGCIIRVTEYWRWHGSFHTTQSLLFPSTQACCGPAPAGLTPTYCEVGGLSHLGWRLLFFLPVSQGPCHPHPTVQPYITQD